MKTRDEETAPVLAHFSYFCGDCGGQMFFTNKPRPPEFKMRIGCEQCGAQWEIMLPRVEGVRNRL